MTIRHFSWNSIVAQADPDHNRESKYPTEYEFTGQGGRMDEGGKRLFKGYFDNRGIYEGAWSSVMTATLDTAEAALAGYTIVQVLAIDTLLSSVDGNVMRFTVEAGDAEATSIVRAYVGLGDTTTAYAFAATPLPLLFGRNAALRMPPSDTCVSDPVDNILVAGRNLLVAWEVANDTTGDSVAAKATLTGATIYSHAGVAQADKVAKNGYNLNGSYAIQLINKIELFD